MTTVKVGPLALTPPPPLGRDDQVGALLASQSGELVNMKHNKETVGDIMSSVGSRHPFALSPSQVKLPLSSPALCLLEEGAQTIS